MYKIVNNLVENCEYLDMILGKNHAGGGGINTFNIVTVQ